MIKDWRTGEVAFEQRDVEFPSTWSINATTIVAQKYFRGPLGTPERESSVRHMVDRVADTITGWGSKDGYFADEQAAEIYNAELKHLLVHQMAAFNSPVWFNVGVEERPQCSACQPWDALVSTPEGLVPIGEVVDRDAVGTKVYDSQGVTKVVATKHNGRKRVLRIHLKSGAYLDVTPDHLVWKAQDAGYGTFVEAGTLRPGDRLEWHRTYASGDGEITPLAIAEAALAGWLQSDGFVGQYQGTNRSLTIEAMTVNDAEREWVSHAMDVVLPGMHGKERTVETQDPALDCRRIRAYGTGLEDFVRRWNLRARGTEMTVPAQLYNAPLPVVAAYLRSLFQAEGYVLVRERSAKIAFDMISEELVRGVQALLSRFGIFSRVSCKDDPRPDRHGCWSLLIGNLGDRIAFRDEIGFLDARKTTKLEASLKLEGKHTAGTKRLTIDRIEDRGVMDVYDIQTESGEYLSGNLRVHNCFILSVEDTMSSILNWYVEEGTIFKGGSGSGVNLSRIRSSQESLKGGGTASGPVSFMRGADASAGTIKSGGKTRRAAKMVILDVDHPDVEEFIWCKSREELKARALREAGFDMDLDGKDSASVQYQNANNSVRVTDEFMRAVEADGDFELKTVLSGEATKRLKARDLMRQIATAAWECADPGVQYDTTINDWHTTPNAGRINGSNPCFPGDALVHTDKGLIPFDELIARVNRGEGFGVYTHDATNPDAPSERVELTSPEAFMITGRNEILRLRFSNGMELRCTPGHKIFTVTRGYVPAKDLRSDDRVKVLDLPTPAIAADRRLPLPTGLDAYREKGDRMASIRLPEKWTEDFAHYLGWFVGDGCFSGNLVSTIYGSEEEQREILPLHRELAAWINGDRAPAPSHQPNGTVQLRQSRRPIARFLETLGLSTGRAAEKVVPWSIEQAPQEMVAAFLQGLFDADGTVHDGGKYRYVGLGTRSHELALGVQRLLSTFGIFSRLYARDAAEGSKFSYARKDGSEVSYQSRGAAYDLRIAGRSMVAFASLIGFRLPSKRTALEAVLAERTRYRTDETVRVVEAVSDGYELTYNLSEPRNHSYIVNGVVVRNCSEYMHLDNSACNLASLNLRKFETGGVFDAEGFKHAVEVIFTAQEIIVGNSSYPTERIAQNAHAYRQLGLGYANLGGLLMSQGLAYDSEEGRAWGSAITALMTGHAYRTSAEIAKVTGPFDGFAADRSGMLRVIAKHRDALRTADTALAPANVLQAARQSWDEALEIGGEHGIRNGQASVLAPTGTIGLMMDCDTTGIEPDLGLVKGKKLVGGGMMRIVNQTVPVGLKRLGYQPEQIEAIVAYIDEHAAIEGAPAFRPEHLPVFDCAMGERSISPSGHIRMMAAAQPWLSGAISKTVNLPESATIEDVEQVFLEGWHLGLKAVAIYRDNCKVAQPLSIAKREASAATATEERAQQHGMIRRRLPKQRPSQTISFQVGDAEGYLTAGEYPGDGLGEIFVKLGKQGSTLSGVMDALAISVSLGLQYGVPLEAYVRKFTNMRFEPAGLTDDPEVRFTSSLVDYIFRRLGLEYLPQEKRQELGIYTMEERTASLDAGPVPAPQPESAPPVDATGQIVLPVDHPLPVDDLYGDAPMCYSCGVKMQRAGSCHVCTSCGTTSGCS
ncbi:MAG: ribonucleoside-diphosphate reductase [Nitriliruptorales bacterium]|nr:ribonucleoside-diphosphate reductase [Nitriliruptorales bacterium]